MTKKLVINADDFGLSEEANRRIIKCYTQGAVTDISILAVAGSFEHAVRLAEDNKLNRIGIHLALTGHFHPAAGTTKSVTSLVDRDTRFSKNCRSFLARYFMGKIKNDEIYNEWKAQILKVKKKGFKITHLDSHEHIHMIPSILKVAVRLAAEENIGYIRFPQEKVDFFAKLNDPWSLIRNILLSYMCGISKKILTASNLKRNSDFIGHARALRIRREELILAISRLKCGLTELCCHPGNREEEAEILCDRLFADELKKYAVELTSY